MRVVRVTRGHGREGEGGGLRGKGVNLGDEQRYWSAQFLHIWGLKKAIFTS
jgi:hypothetical protein